MSRVCCYVGGISRIWGERDNGFAFFVAFFRTLFGLSLLLHNTAGTETNHDFDDERALIREIPSVLATGPSRAISRVARVSKLVGSHNGPVPLAPPGRRLESLGAGCS